MHLAENLIYYTHVVCIIDFFLLKGVKLSGKFNYNVLIIFLHFGGKSHHLLSWIIAPQL